MAYTFPFTNGYMYLSAVIASDDDVELTSDDRAHGLVSIAISAASKEALLGLGEGEYLFVINSGDTNAVTLKNTEDDTGTSLGIGEVALVVGSATADASIVLVLNASGGGGD